MKRTATLDIRLNCGECTEREFRLRKLVDRRNRALGWLVAECAHCHAENGRIRLTGAKRHLRDFEEDPSDLMYQGVK